MSYSVSKGSLGVNLIYFSSNSLVSIEKSPYFSCSDIVSPDPTLNKDCFSKIAILPLTVLFKNTKLVNWTWFFSLISETLNR